MKRVYLLGMVLLVLVACTSNDDKSDAYGNFETDETIVSSEISGKLIDFDAELGLEIEEGETFGSVDTLQIVLRIQQLAAQQKAVEVKKVNINSQVNVLKEQLNNAQIRQQRVQAMFTDKSATQQQLDDVDGQVRVIEKQLDSTKSQYLMVNEEVKVLQSQLEITYDQLRRCQLVSPISGIVLEKYVEKGEMLIASKPVVKIADISTLDLRVYVSGGQLPQIKIGQQVEVLIDQSATTNQELSGIISWISPEAEFTPKIIQTKEERVKLVYAVKVNVKNDGRLKIGMPGEVNFYSNTAE